MSIPNHKESCLTKAFDTTCPYCGSVVYYFKCSCGSKQFFDELHHPWPIHECKEYVEDVLIGSILSSTNKTEEEIELEIYMLQKKHNISSSGWDIIEETSKQRSKNKLKINQCKLSSNNTLLKGQIIEIIKNISIFDRYLNGEVNQLTIGLLGDLAKLDFAELRLRTKPNLNNECKEYRVLIDTRMIKEKSIRKNLHVVVKIMKAKTSIPNLYILKEILPVK